MLEEWWLLHLGFSSNKFPRTVGTPQQFLVKSESEYLKTILVKRKYYSVFTSLYSEKDVASLTVDKIFIDIDGPSLAKALEVTRKLVASLKELYEAEPLVYFSGCRGFHIYIHFKPLTISHPSVLRTFVEKYLPKVEGLDYKVVPTNSLKKLSRLPFTINFESLHKFKKVFYCVPVDVNKSLGEIKQLASNPNPSDLVDLQDAKVVRELLKILSKEKEEKVKEAELKEIKLEVKESTKQKYLKVVEKILKCARFVFDGRRRIIHFLIVPTLVMCGFRDEEIVAVCKYFIEQSGADWLRYERYVLDSIKRTREGNWKPWRVETFLLENPDLLPIFEKIKG